MTSRKRGRAGAAVLALASKAHARPVEPLLTLGEGIVRATIVGRPSERNKSPYVGDVRLPDGRVAIAHMPSMDMGGKCFPGVEALLRPATDKANRPVGADAVGKYGTPKCEFILQALRCDEPENAEQCGVWVGAHPSIGEKVAHALVSGGALTAELGGSPIAAVRREVTGVAGTDMRCDFLLEHENGSSTVVEVKTVVDTDYDPALSDERPAAAPRFYGPADPPGGVYQRAAIFPWGKSRQQGPDGEKVVSARAIKHVRELTALAKGERRLEEGGAIAAAILFVVVRGDAVSFRPNEEACPSFARYLRQARAAGVRVLAHRVRWGDTTDALGHALHEGPIPVVM